MAENVEVSGIQLLVDSGNTEEALSQFRQLLNAANVNVEKFTTVIARMGKESEELTYKVRGVTTAGNEVTTTINKTSEGFEVASVQVRNLTDKLEAFDKKQKEIAAKELIEKNKATAAVNNLTRIDQELINLIKNFNILNAKQIKLGISEPEMAKIRRAETAILNLVLAGKTTHRELASVYRAMGQDANALFTGVNASVAEHIRTIQAGIQKVEESRRRLAAQVAAANKAEKILGPQVAQASTTASQAELLNYTKKLNEYKNAAADAQVKARQLTDAWKAAEKIAAGGAVTTKRWSEEKKKLVASIVALINAQKQLGAAAASTAALQAKQIQASQVQAANMRTLAAETTKLKATLERLNARQISLGIRPDQLNVIKQAQAQLLNLVSTGKITTAQLKSVWRTMQKDSATVFYGVANQAAQQFRRIQNAINGVKTTNDVATKQIFISWRTIGRFFVSHILYAGFYRMIGAIQTGIRDTVEFSLKIDEIRTLTQRTGESFIIWEDRVRSLSDAYGRDLKDVAEGAYETISNQVADAAQATTFLATALDFSKAAVSTTEDSINLLSSAINSFQMTTLEADHIAASFFKTIDLGRVRASEMADTFGRVGTLGNNLGLSLDEVNAAVATLTVQGVRYNEAFTLITNVMIKLLKPTKAMKELFKEWGVETGEAAIATYGWVGVLSLLEKESEKGATRLGELASRIRAVRGITGLAGNESVFQNYTKALDEIIDSLDEYEKAVQIISKNTGQIWKEEATKIKNYFTVDVAGSVVDTILKLNTASDGSVRLASNLTGIFDKLFAIGKLALAAAVASLTVKTIGTTVAALSKLAAMYAVATKNVQVYGNVSGVTLGRVAVISKTTAATTAASVLVMRQAYLALVANIQLVATALTTVFVYAAFKAFEKHKEYLNSLSDNYNQALKEVEDAANRLTLVDKDKALSELNAVRDTVQTSARVTMFYLKTLFDEYQDKVIAISATEKTLANKVNSYVKTRLDTYKDYFSGVESALNDLDKKVVATLEKVEKVQTSREDSDFARSLKLAGSPQEQLKLLEAKIRQQDAEASELEAKGLYSSAEKTRDRVEDLIEQAKNIAAELGPRVTTYTTSGEKLYKTTKQVELEKSLEDVLENQNAFLAKQAENYKTQYDTLVNIAKVEQDRLKTLGEIANKIAETTENAGTGKPEEVINRTTSVAEQLKEFENVAEAVGAGLTVEQAVSKTKDEILDQIDALESQRSAMLVAGQSAEDFSIDLKGIEEVTRQLNEQYAQLDKLDNISEKFEVDPTIVQELQTLLEGDPLADIQGMAQEIPLLVDTIATGFSQAIEAIPEDVRVAFEKVTGHAITATTTIGEIQNVLAQVANTSIEMQGKAQENLVGINNELTIAKGSLQELIPLLNEAENRVTPELIQPTTGAYDSGLGSQVVLTDSAIQFNKNAEARASGLKNQFRTLKDAVNDALLNPLDLTPEKLSKIQQRAALLIEDLNNTPADVKIGFDAKKLQTDIDAAMKQLTVFYQRMGDKKEAKKAIENFNEVNLQWELLGEAAARQLKIQESINLEMERMPDTVQNVSDSVNDLLNKSLDETLERISQIKYELEEIERARKETTRDFEKKLSVGGNTGANVNGVRFSPQTNNTTRQQNTYNLTVNLSGQDKTAKTTARELVKEINTGLRLGHFKIGV